VFRCGQDSKSGYMPKEFKGEANGSVGTDTIAAIDAVFGTEK